MMPRTRTGTRRTGRTGKTMSALAPRPVAVVEVRPIRGVKLKHVSTFVMLVALLCLFAYLAGRVDVSAATSAPTNVPGVTRASLAAGRADSKEPNMFLGLRTVKYEVQDMAKAKEGNGKVFG